MTEVGMGSARQPPASDSVTALVLCGGQSRRFGADKTREPLGDRPLLDHLLDGLPESWTVVCVGEERATRRAVTWTREVPPGGGPNAGIAAGLAVTSSGTVVVLAGDLPFAAAAAPRLVAALAATPGVQAVYAVDPAGQWQPLLAAYRTSALRAALPDPPAGTAAKRVAGSLSHRTVAVEAAAALDVDTPADLGRAAAERDRRLGPMQAITVPTPGGPDSLVLADVPAPKPGPGEVLVDVVAAGVNRADVMQRMGFYPPPPGASPLLGLEVSGRIAAVGADVSGWQVGDEVCALLAGGGYAEQVTVPAEQVLPVPAGVDLVDAAALPEVACTVWSNVFLTANLQPGEVLLVHGGSSGIGTMAIQLGREVGARVAVTAGTADKLEVCRQLGADILVNYRDEDFVAQVREATDGHGADVVLDNMGAKYLARNVEVLAPNGRLVVIGLQGGRTAELDLNALLRKRAAIIATSLRARPAAEKAAVVAAVREHVWPLVEAGRVRPIVHARWPLAQARAAHEQLESSTHVGKILLTVEH